MKHYILLIVFFIQVFTSLLFAQQQRPWRIEKVKPVVDSVQTEVNRLYTLATTADKCLINAENDHVISQKWVDAFSYLKNDTVVVLLIDENNTLIKRCFFNSIEIEPLGVDNTQSSFSKEETDLLAARKKAIKEAQKEKYEIKAPKECKIEYIFYPNRTGFTLYAITVPLIDSILPVSSYYLFLFDGEVKVQRFEKFKNKHIMSIRKKDNPPNSTLSYVGLPVQSTNNFKPLIPCFYKYRRFHHNLRLTVIGAGINKRILEYDAVKNEITIKLFPVER